MKFTLILQVVIIGGVFVHGKIEISHSHMTSGSYQQTQSPWDTPLDELKGLTETACALRNISGIEFAELHWQECIRPFFPPSERLGNSHENDSEDSEQEKEFFAFFCRDPGEYKSCWNFIIDKLNECEPGRGNVSGSIYLAMYDASCENHGIDVIEKRKLVSTKGQLCEHNYNTDVCKETIVDWSSIDVCKRFAAEKKCDESAIASCPNEFHKQLNKENLENIEKTLGCRMKVSSTQGFLHGSASNNFSIWSLNLLFIITLLTTLSVSLLSN